MTRYIIEYFDLGTNEWLPLPDKPVYSRKDSANYSADELKRRLPMNELRVATYERIENE